MNRIIGAVLALALSAGCGSDGGSEATPATETLTVRVTAEQVIGCMESTGRSGLDIGNGSRLTVSDEAGEVVGTGTFNLSPGLTPGVDTCDWTAEASVPGDAGFYVLDAGGELATLSGDELLAADWAVDLHITITGDVTVR